MRASQKDCTAAHAQNLRLFSHFKNIILKKYLFHFSRFKLSYFCNFRSFYYIDVKNIYFVKKYIILLIFLNNFF